MRRGDVVIMADRAAGDYAGKPRPAVIVQSDAFGAVTSVTLCPLTSGPPDATLLRLRVEPSPTLPLAEPSFIMVDKITTVRRDRIGRVIGTLTQADLVQLNQRLVVFLGIG